MLIIIIIVSDISSNRKNMIKIYIYIETKEEFYRLWKFDIKFWKINYLLKIVAKIQLVSETIKNKLSGIKKSEFIFI